MSARRPVVVVGQPGRTPLPTPIRVLEVVARKRLGDLTAGALALDPSLRSGEQFLATKAAIRAYASACDDPPLGALLAVVAQSRDEVAVAAASRLVAARLCEARR